MKELLAFVLAKLLTTSVSRDSTDTKSNVKLDGFQQNSLSVDDNIYIYIYIKKIEKQNNPQMMNLLW